MISLQVFYPTYFHDKIIKLLQWSSAASLVGQSYPEYVCEFNPLIKSEQLVFLQISWCRSIAFQSWECVPSPHAQPIFKPTEVDSDEVGSSIVTVFFICLQAAADQPNLERFSPLTLIVQEVTQGFDRFSIAHFCSLHQVMRHLCRKFLRRILNFSG